MKFRKLRKFNCGNNRLTSLPASISEMFPNLNKLACSYNKLKLLPEKFVFEYLIELGCTHNQLKMFSQ